MVAVSHKVNITVNPTVSLTESAWADSKKGTYCIK